MIKCDFHMHSTSSDGKLSPKELVYLAKNANLEYFSLTDHDTISGISEASYYAKKLGIKFIPGIELSTEHNGESVHILGFFNENDYKNQEFLHILEGFKENRLNRARKIVENLKTFFDINLDIDKVLLSGKDTITRPHIAKSIIAAGYPYTFNEIFDKFIGFDSKAYVPLSRVSTKEGVKLLKDFGAIVFLAHPVSLKKSKISDLLMYDFDGIEAVYFRNTEDDTKKLIEIAKENNLYISCGSDFHGIENDIRHGEVGSVTLPKIENLDKLIEWIYKIK